MIQRGMSEYIARVLRIHGQESRIHQRHEHKIMPYVADEVGEMQTPNLLCAAFTVHEIRTYLFLLD